MGQQQFKAKEQILTEIEINNLIEETSFTREEILQWHDGFKKDCPDGRLTKKQFIDIYKVFYPQGKAEKFCNHVFKVFGNNGVINFTAISVTAAGDAKKKLILAFKMYDVDKNARVDKKEMETIIECLYDLLGEEHRTGENAPKQRVKTIMARLDDDNNGFLNESEFVEGCLNDSILRSLLAPNA